MIFQSYIFLLLKNVLKVLQFLQGHRWQISIGRGANFVHIVDKDFQKGNLSRSLSTSVLKEALLTQIY